MTEQTTEYLLALAQQRSTYYLPTEEWRPVIESTIARVVALEGAVNEQRELLTAIGVKVGTELAELKRRLAASEMRSDDLADRIRMLEGSALSFRPRIQELEKRLTAMHEPSPEDRQAVADAALASVEHVQRKSGQQLAEEFSAGGTTAEYGQSPTDALDDARCEFCQIAVDRRSVVNGHVCCHRRECNQKAIWGRTAEPTIAEKVARAKAWGSANGKQPRFMEWHKAYFWDKDGYEGEESRLSVGTFLALPKNECGGDPSQCCGLGYATEQAAWIALYDALKACGMLPVKEYRSFACCECGKTFPGVPIRTEDGGGYCSECFDGLHKYDPGTPATGTLRELQKKWEQQVEASIAKIKEYLANGTDVQKKFALDSRAKCAVASLHAAELAATLDAMEPPKQPDPTPNTHAPVWPLVIADMQARDEAGRQRYGTRLQPFNGRNSLQDAYEEALDLCVYLKTAIIEAAAREKP